jgi:hypothetical protein
MMPSTKEVALPSSQNILLTKEIIKQKNTNMKYIKLLILLALSGSVWAQKEVQLASFSKIKMDVPVRIRLVAGNETKAVHSKDLSGITFTVKEGELSIDNVGESFWGDDFIEIHFKELKQVEMNGAGVVEMKSGSVIEGDDFTLTNNGAAKGNFNLKVQNLNVALNGATKLTLTGSANKASIELSGASKLYASELVCKDLKLEAAGASYFAIYSNNDLQIDAAGASKGVYSGNPINKQINISGISSIVDSNTGENMNDERMGNDDTTRIKVGKKKFIIIEDNDEVATEDKKEKVAKTYDLKNVYAGFELGMNQFVSPDLNFNLPINYSFLDCKMEKSWFYGLNLLEGDLQLVKNKLAITSGLGMEFQNFRFNSNQILTPNVNIVSADSGSLTLTKNKLYNYNLNVPLLIKFAPRNKKDRNNFHFAVGVIGSFKAYSHLRIESSAKGYEEEAKIKDDFNINPFRLTATARIGYGWFRAFANYSLTPYFNTQNNNPDIRVFSAGITLIPFQ